MPNKAAKKKSWFNRSEKENQAVVREAVESALKDSSPGTPEFTAGVVAMTSTAASAPVEVGIRASEPYKKEEVVEALEGMGPRNMEFDKTARALRRAVVRTNAYPNALPQGAVILMDIEGDAPKRELWLRFKKKMHGMLVDLSERVCREDVVTDDLHRVLQDRFPNFLNKSWELEG